MQKEGWEEEDVKAKWAFYSIMEYLLIFSSFWRSNIYFYGYSQLKISNTQFKQYRARYKKHIN